MSIRNDREPVEKVGYEPTGEGAYAECPDHGSRMWWSAKRGDFFCPAEGPGAQRLHGDDDRLAPADIYLEHDEGWRVVNGCLWIDKYEDVAF